MFIYMVIVSIFCVVAMDRNKKKMNTAVKLRIQHNFLAHNPSEQSKVIMNVGVVTQERLFFYLPNLFWARLGGQR